MVKLRCKCGDWKMLEFERHVYEQNDYVIVLDLCPLLVCPTCGNIDLPDHTYKQIQKFILDNRDSDRKVYQIKGHSEEPFVDLEYTKGCVDFKFSKSDCFFIPALNLGKLGDFTPVFFSIDILIYYMHNPRYRLILGANTYGVISSDEFAIPFGINRSGKVIMWLTDIVKLPDEEQYYLRSKNVPSDHDVGSEFYEGQFEGIWAEPSNLKQIISLKKVLSQIIAQIYGFKIFMLDKEVDVISDRISKPILFTDKEVGDTYEEINKVLVESLNVKEIKAYIINNSSITKKDLGEIRGLKLFRCWLIEFLKLTEEKVDETLLPLFVLYDLRVVYAHLASAEGKEEKFISICSRLGLDENCRDNKTIFIVTIDKILSMYKIIIGQINTGVLNVVEF